MRKFYCIALTLLLVTVYQSKAQNSFSFACPKDTVINNCAVTCITVKSRIPDIRSATDSYVINSVSGAPGGCFVMPVDPGLPGTPTSLTIDDTYSTAISLPFTFPFYGASYNSLIASTNGFLSFDVSKAGLFAHYSTTPGNLPNTGYDRALIMGPYHDLDPAYTTSPTQRIKYEVIGAAPHRKWILSFYKVPLFLTSCQNLIENTHEIVIYEGLGVIDVFVKDKQICNAWNNGQSMIGLQNYNRNAGIMAPGRKVTDPPWGSIGMNESWRFTPASGPTLYRKVELYDLAGTLVSTGDTTSIGNNVFEVNFPNVCPGSTTTYVIKSTYADISTPGSFVYGTDTIRVVRPNAINVNANVTNLACNGTASGSFTVAPVGGTGPFEYSIDGGLTYQPTGTFSNLSGGVYTVTIRDNGSTCLRDTVINIIEPSALNETVATANATCSASPNGTITVTGSGGVPGPGYTYSIDGINFQPSNVFYVNNGTYTVTIQDANNCTKTQTAIVDLTNDLAVGVRTDTTICKGASLVLTTSGNGASFLWTPAAGLNDATLQSPVATPDVTTSYVVTATLGQCSKTATINLGVVEAVQVNAGSDVSVITGDQAQLYAIQQGANSFLWTPPTGLSSTTILNPIVKPTTTTTYTITVKNDVGCSASDDVIVTVIPYCIKVKNAFTPNGDGINDLWSVYDQYDCLKNVAIKVFNRYGNEVFSSNNYHNDWDGRYKGKSVPDGTYYAVINYTLVTGKLFTAKTDLTIIR